MQDAYIKVWHGAASYQPAAGRPMTWLVSIARYRAIDVMRRRSESQLPVNEDGSDWLDSVADPTDREADFVQRDRLRLCLGRLDETQRRCFLDAYHEGFSREELAERYGRPVNTIKTWLHRSAQALRVCLDET